MNHSRKVDQDDIVRARNVLPASGRRTPREEVDAYRVLAQVSPASYLPRLARALQALGFENSHRHTRPDRLALCEEAVAVARSIDPGEPTRADVLYDALDTCQGVLYSQGRREEGLALRAEMVAVGRAQAAVSGNPVVRGLEVWARGLAEEGRYDEAADVLTELHMADRPKTLKGGSHSWSLLEWIAVLHDAGRFGEALAAFETLVRMEREEAANDRGPTACYLYSLIGYAQMLDAHGRGEQAGLARQEALALLTELADTGERKTWSGYQKSFWAVLLSFPGAEGDRPAPRGPRPPSGATKLQWSRDVRERYFDSRRALREEVDALAPLAAEDPDRHLADLVGLHRVLTIRSAVHGESHRCRYAEDVRHLFDEGVGLARRLAEHAPAAGTRELARSLIDRSTYRTSAFQYGPALDDFREALSCLGEAGPT
ncbi:hypothetical protein ACFU5Z_33610 [Streptomyces sp. NPDC057521]|uniref:hypothetical protein n=1 Tax=Streptomyces sp. NPDC057521 TaxID=3346156 RepID=UPI0036758EE7